MSQIGSKLRKASGRLGHVRMMHWCPGCNETHGYMIASPDGGPLWQFNGDSDKPTFTPSMRLFVIHRTDDDDKPLPAPVEETLCHYFITDGKIQFCSDSPHHLSGQTVDLPDWPYAPGTYGGIDE